MGKDCRRPYVCLVVHTPDRAPRGLFRNWSYTVKALYRNFYVCEQQLATIKYLSAEWRARSPKSAQNIQQCSFSLPSSFQLNLKATSTRQFNHNHQQTVYVYLSLWNTCIHTNTKVTIIVSVLWKTYFLKSHRIDGCYIGSNSIDNNSL